MTQIKVVAHKGSLHHAILTPVSELHIGAKIIGATLPDVTKGVRTTEVRTMEPHPGKYSHCQHINGGDCYDERIPVYILGTKINN